MLDDLIKACEEDTSAVQHLVRKFVTALDMPDLIRVINLYGQNAFLVTTAKVDISWHEAAELSAEEAVIDYIGAAMLERFSKIPFETYLRGVDDLLCELEEPASEDTDYEFIRGRQALGDCPWACAIELTEYRDEPDVHRES